MSLSIRPRTKATKPEQLREMARAIDQQITEFGRESSQERARVIVNGQVQPRQLLLSALKDLISKEESIKV